MSTVAAENGRYVGLVVPAGPSCGRVLLKDDPLLNGCPRSLSDPGWRGCAVERAPWATCRCTGTSAAQVLDGPVCLVEVDLLLDEPSPEVVDLRRQPS